MGATDVFAAIVVGHLLGDYWIQSDRQAARKADPGWAGRLACAAHVATLTATIAAVVAVVVAVSGWVLSPAALVVGLAVNAATHYAADRRAPLRWLACATGSGGFVEGGGLPLLDQVWHIGWAYVVALLIAS
jgi:hypothetical protein